MRETSEADVSELGELLGVAFSARERADAVDRLNTLADIHEQLEAVPTDDPRAHRDRRSRLDLPGLHATDVARFAFEKV